MKRKVPHLDKPYRRHRPLTEDEERLWLSEVGEEALTSSTHRGEIKRGAGEGKIKAGFRLHPGPPPTGEGRPPAPPEPQAVDAHTRKKILRGKAKIEATLDLHGHHRPAAHAELVRFIESARARDLSLVLVITGKGKNGKPGVLREELPRWLNAPPLQGAIIAYDTAGPAHGGEGAWYVRIRKRKTTRA